MVLKMNLAMFQEGFPSMHPCADQATIGTVDESVQVAGHDPNHQDPWLVEALGWRIVSTV